MNVNELTDLIVKITRSNKKQQYSRALASVINDEKGAPVFDSIDYVVGDQLDSTTSNFIMRQYRLGDAVKVQFKGGNGGYYPYWLVLSKEQCDKFGREVQYIKNGQCFYTEILDDYTLGPISGGIMEDENFMNLTKDYYGWFHIAEVLSNLYDNHENSSTYGAEQLIITYDGVQYKYDKNDVIIDVNENESVSTQSFNLLNQEA